MDSALTTKSCNRKSAERKPAKSLFVGLSLLPLPLSFPHGTQLALLLHQQIPMGSNSSLHA